MSFNTNTGHGIGRPRISLSSAEKPDLTAQPLSEATRSALATPTEMRTPEQVKACAQVVRPARPGVPETPEG